MCQCRLFIVATINMRILLVLCLSFLSLIGCERQEQADWLPLSEIPGGTIGFSSQSKLDALLHELDKRGVKYWLQQNKNVQYRLADTALFRAAKRKAEFGDNLKRNYRETMFDQSEISRSLLKKGLKEAGIQFDEIEKEDGNIYIYWSQLDGPRADIIVQNARVEAYKQLLESANGDSN